MSLSFLERFDELVLIGAHGYLSDIDRSVGHCKET